MRSISGRFSSERANIVNVAKEERLVGFSTPRGARDWFEYMYTRRGTFEFRARTRYAAVADKLFELGLKDGDLIVDVGAGTCQFDHYLRTQRGWTGRYLPVDAVVCGTDLETWRPQVRADFHIAIEVIEHVFTWRGLLHAMHKHSRKGTVVTTPNPETVDVIACDPTHISSVSAHDLAVMGFHSQPRQFFGREADTLLAWRVQ